MILDISSYQAQIDWKKVVTMPELKAVYIKASEGVNAPDKGFMTRAQDARKAGYDIGFYHFATLNKTDVISDAISEASYFMKITSGFEVKLPYALDIEANPGKLTKEQVLLYIKTFFSTLDKAGKSNYCLYSYTPFLNSNLPDNHGLGNVKLWLASYTPAYMLPRGWDKAWLWQYTQKGFIPGILGNVDLSKLV